MSYDGYLVKVGDYKIPFKYINSNTYKASMNVQDLDSYRDADGVLHRNTLSHVPCKVEFETANMFHTDFADMMGNIQRNYVNAAERKAVVSAYVPETDSYVTQDMYMPDITPTIINQFSGKLLYGSTRIAIVGY